MLLDNLSRKGKPTIELREVFYPNQGAHLGEVQQAIDRCIQPQSAPKSIATNATNSDANVSSFESWWKRAAN